MAYETVLELIIFLMAVGISILWQKNIELHQEVNGLKDYYEAEVRSLRLSRKIAMKDRC
jgi:hypothetical protein